MCSIEKRKVVVVMSISCVLVMTTITNKYLMDEWMSFGFQKERKYNMGACAKQKFV